MAKCQWCNQEMTKADTCTANKEVKYSDGTKLPAKPYHSDRPYGRCGDCGTKNGGFHHPGCDCEKCAKCGGQLISCGCLGEEE